MVEYDDLKLGRFRVIGTIAQNPTSIIYRAKRDQDSTVYVLKKIPNCPETIFERNIYNLIGNHPNIVNIQSSFEIPRFTILVMGLAKSDFCSILESVKMKDWAPIWPNYYAQLLSGVEHLHSIGISHCDLKPDNLLLFEQNEIKQLKICDFGLATNQAILYQRKWGTLSYMSPECYQQQKYSPQCYYFTQSNDIWALGVLLINFSSLKSPWREPVFEDRWFNLFYGDTQPMINVGVLKQPFKIHLNVVSIIERLLHLRPQKRPNINQLQQLFSKITIDCE